MILTTQSGWQFDTDLGVDCSVGVHFDQRGTSCFGLPPPHAKPLYSTKSGSVVNCDLVTFCIHSAGTHTEWIGHLSKKRISITNVLPISLQKALLLSITPTPIESTSEFYPCSKPGDLVVTRSALIAARNWLNFDGLHFTALCIRTLPNGDDKKERSYSGRNAPYLSMESAELIASDWNVQHFLCDLPSVDKESSGDDVVIHRILWRMPMSGDVTPDNGARSTITELAYFHEVLPDGFYMLDLQTTNLDSDATLSRPVLFPIQQQVHRSGLDRTAPIV